MTDVRPEAFAVGGSVASRSAPDPESATYTEAFGRRLLAHAASQLPGADADELNLIARETLAVGRRRDGDQILVRVGDDLPTADPQACAIVVVTADAPYLVDSVRAELERSGYSIDRLLHPQIVVARDAAGELSEVYDVDDNADVPDGAIVESWMYLEVEALDESSRGALTERLTGVLADVHHAVADAPEMYTLIRRLADELTDDPGQFDRETSAEAGELLRWLADGNYMILGHVAYSANDLANPYARTGNVEAQGVLRGAARISVLELLPAFRSGAPLVIFKSPLVSTVRRSARYDCVTVISSGADSVAGLHVFLGLITNAEDGTVARVPVVRRRIAEIMFRSGVRADSYTGRRLLAALRTLPRDELLEAPTGDLLRLAHSWSTAPSTAPSGVFARVHLNRDFVSVLVYFPADRFGPETRRRVVRGHLAVLAGRAHRPGRPDRRTRPRPYAILVALRPGVQPPSPIGATVEPEVAKVTRRWSDDLADLLALRSASTRPPASPQVRRRDARGYKQDFLPPTAARDLLRFESLPPTTGSASTCTCRPRTTTPTIA